MTPSHIVLAERVADAIRSYCVSEACIWTVGEINEVTTVADDIGRLAASALGSELEELGTRRRAWDQDVADLIEVARALLDVAACLEPSFEEFDDLRDALARADRRGW